MTVAIFALLGGMGLLMLLSATVAVRPEGR